MDKRMCWLALCWLLGGCLENNNNHVISSTSNSDKIDNNIKDNIFTTKKPTKVQSYLWPKPNTYMTRWDKVNMDEMLASKRLMQHYFNCLLNKGPCPPDGREMKRAIPEALATGCAKCSKSQLEGSIKVIRYLREYEPVKFEMLAQKFDPKGIYRKKYLELTPEETNNSLNDEQSIDDQRLKRFVKKQRNAIST